MRAIWVGQLQRAQGELLAYGFVQIADSVHHARVHFIRFGQAGKYLLKREKAELFP